ncbi:MAG: AI-2E family transporter, partial [Bacteroidota bacterium]
MQFSFNRNHTTVFIAIILGIAAFAGFLYQTHFLFYPLSLFLISLFLLVPYRKKSKFIRRMIFLISLSFILWVIGDLSYALLPFALAFLLAYLLDPFVTYLEKKKIPRWLSSIILDLIFIGAISLIGFFVFPIIFAQLDDAIKKVSVFFKTFSSNFDQHSMYKFFTNLGFGKAVYKSVIQAELLPRMESIYFNLLSSLMSFLTGVSVISTKLINIVLVPVLFFYFLTDFARFKALLRQILEQKNRKVLFDLQRIDIILRKYIGWQIVSAIIVATCTSILFSIFNIPFPVVLGLLCGLLNPIPYLGLAASSIIAILTVIIISPGDVTGQIIAILCSIWGIHFINTYL